MVEYAPARVPPPGGRGVLDARYAIRVNISGGHFVVPGCLGNVGCMMISMKAKEKRIARFMTRNNRSVDRSSTFVRQEEDGSCIYLDPENGPMRVDYWNRVDEHPEDLAEEFPEFY